MGLVFHETDLGWVQSGEAKKRTAPGLERFFQGNVFLLHCLPNLDSTTNSVLKKNPENEEGAEVAIADHKQRIT